MGTVEALHAKFVRRWVHKYS